MNQTPTISTVASVNAFDTIRLLTTRDHDTSTVESTTDTTSTSTTPGEVTSTVLFFEHFDPATFIACIVACIILTLILNGLCHYISSRKHSRPPGIRNGKHDKAPLTDNTYSNVPGSPQSNKPLLGSFYKKLTNNSKSSKNQHIEMDPYGPAPSFKATANDPECVYDDIGCSQWPPPPPPSLLINGDVHKDAKVGQNHATWPPPTTSNQPEDIYDDIGMDHRNTNGQHSAPFNPPTEEIYDDIGHGQPQSSCYVEEELYDDIVNLRPHRDNRNDDRNTVYEAVSEENIYVN